MGWSVVGRWVGVRPHRLELLVGIGTVMAMPVFDMSAELTLVPVLVAALEMAPTRALVLHVAVVGLGGSTTGTAAVVSVVRPRRAIGR